MSDKISMECTGDGFEGFLKKSLVGQRIIKARQKERGGDVQSATPLRLWLKIHGDKGTLPSFTVRCHFGDPERERVYSFDANPEDEYREIQQFLKLYLNL